MASQRDKVLAAIILIVLIALAFTRGLNLAPSYEGPHVYVYGLQPPNSQTVYTINDPNPCDNGIVSCPMVTSVGTGVKFDSNTYRFSGSTTTLGITGYVSAYGIGQQSTVNVGTTLAPVQNAATGQPAPPVATIDYTVQDPYNSSQYVEVQGYIMEYNLGVTINVQSSSNYATYFGGEVVWVGLYSQSWEPYALSASTTGNATIGGWDAPLLLVFVGGSQSDGGSSLTTIPSWENTGQQILDLYSTPQVSTDIGSLGGVSGANSTLASEGSAYAPSQYMSEIAYFPVTMSHVGATCNGVDVFGVCAGTVQFPALTLNFQLYELQLGRYLWTNPTTTTSTGVGTCPTGDVSYNNGCIPAWEAAVYQWLNNPLNLLMLAVVVIVAIYVAVSVISKRIPGIPGKKA